MKPRPVSLLFLMILIIGCTDQSASSTKNSAVAVVSEDSRPIDNLEKGCEYPVFSRNYSMIHHLRHGYITFIIPPSITPETWSENFRESFRFNPIQLRNARGMNFDESTDFRRSDFGDYIGHFEDFSVYRSKMLDSKLFYLTTHDHDMLALVFMDPDFTGSHFDEKKISLDFKITSKFDECFQLHYNVVATRDRPNLVEINNFIISIINQYDPRKAY